MHYYLFPLSSISKVATPTDQPFSKLPTGSNSVVLLPSPSLAFTFFYIIMNTQNPQSRLYQFASRKRNKTPNAVVDTYLPRLKMQMRAFAAFTTPTANLFQTLGLSFPPLILLRHLPKRLYATSTNGPVFARPSRPIVCAAWSNGVAGRQTSRLRAVGLGLGRKKSLALELEPGLIAGWSLGKRNLGATHRCFLTLSHFGRTV